MSFVIASRSAMRSVISTPVAITRGEKKPKENIVVAAIMTSAYDRIAQTLPTGKITFDVNAASRGAIFAADTVAKGLIESGRMGSTPLALRIDQGLSKVADKAGDLNNDIFTLVGGLGGLVVTFLKASSEIGLLIAVSTVAAAPLTIALMGTFLAVYAVGIGTDSLVLDTIDKSILDHIEDEDDTSSDDDPSDDDPSDGDPSDDDSDDDSDDGAEPTEDDNSAEDSLEPDVGDGGTPSDVDGTVDAHAIALIDWLRRQPGVEKRAGERPSIIAPLVLVTEVPAGDAPDRLTVRIDRTTRPNEEGGRGRGGSRNPPRHVGFGVIDYVDQRYPGAVPSPLGSRDPAGPGAWECPWVFIPGGHCGYYYCPYERNPLTGEPILQLIEAECHA